MAGPERVGLIVCGSRGWQDGDTVTQWLEAFSEAYRVHLFEGCCTGADSFACEFSGKLERHEHFPAEWEKYGKRAGPVRNATMLEGVLHNQREFKAGAFVLVFKEDFGAGTSSGSEHMAKIAKAAGVRGLVIRGSNAPKLPDRATLWPEPIQETLLSL